MEAVANALVVLVAALHVYILVLEMFLWERKPGRALHGYDPEMAKATAAPAANQGLYNGFLAAGLIWGLYLGEAGFQVKIFFLLCVAIAGLYGAATVGRRILFIQTVPAVVALIALALN